MVVEGDDPRGHLMRSLQLRVGLGLRVAGPVVVQTERGRSGPHPCAGPVGRQVAVGRLVHVVAEEHHGIHTGQFRGAAPCAVEAPLEVLARGEDEAELFGRSVGVGERPGPSDRAGLVAGAEPVEVPGVRLESAHVDVHRVSEFRCRDGDPRRHQIGELLVRGDVERHLDRAVGSRWRGGCGQVHAVDADRSGRGRQTRPEHHPVRQRVPARDPQTERCRCQGRWRGSGGGDGPPGRGAVGATATAGVRLRA